VVQTGAITKWHDTKDWKDSEKYQQTQKQTNNAFRNSKKYPVLSSVIFIISASYIPNV